MKLKLLAAALLFAATTHAMQPDQQHKRAHSIESAQNAKRMKRPATFSTLFKAAQGNLEKLVSLLNTGANPNIKNRKGVPLLTRILQNNWLDAADVLLHYGADINQADTHRYGGQNALTFMTHSGENLPALIWLLNNKCNMDTINSANETALLHALLQNNFAAFKMLCESNANLNFTIYGEYQSLLHILIENDPALRLPQDLKYLVCLLEHGANVNIPEGHFNSTPLIDACIKDGPDTPYKNIVQVLLHYGANPLLTDRDGNTADCYTQNSDILKLLRLPYKPELPDYIRVFLEQERHELLTACYTNNVTSRLCNRELGKK